MDKTRAGKIFTILLCAALIVAVLIYNRFNDKKNIEYADINKIMTYDFNQSDIKNGKLNPEILPDDKLSLNTYDREEVDEKYISNLKEAINQDFSYNAESLTTEPTFELLYIDVLYKKELPSGIYTNMMDEIQRYINDRYLIDNTIIKKVAIIEKTIEIDDTNNRLMYAIRLDKGSDADYAYITIDLSTYEYFIYDIEI